MSFKDHSVVIVLADRTRRKRLFRLQARKNGERRLRKTRVMSLLLIINSSTIGQMTAFPDDPISVLVPTTSPQNDSVFTSFSHPLGPAKGAK